MESVFSTIRSYFRDAFWGMRSVIGSCVTAIPYLFSAGEFRKEVTEQYPDPISSRTADDLPSRSRGLLYNDIERCTGCKECELVCPTQCIRVETEPGSDVSKIWVATFDIDFSRCIFCGLCVEACLPQSLIHTRQYEGAVYQLPAMVSKFGRGHVTREQRERWASLRQQSEEGEEGNKS
jgi:formate hydrogenlyase subunit 6/NADH:ubiquinone oxidoreductase subunit I